MTNIESPAPASAEELQRQIQALQTQQAALQQRAEVAAHLAGLTEAEKDEGLLRLVGAAMERRLAECRAKGRNGWWSSQASDADLANRLRAKVDAGDHLDAAIFAAMLHVRAHLG